MVLGGSSVPLQKGLKFRRKTVILPPCNFLLSRCNSRSAVRQIINGLHQAPWSETPPLDGRGAFRPSGRAVPFTNPLFRGKMFDMRPLTSTVVLLLMLLSPSLAPATVDYARQTGQACAGCHVDAIGGGKLTDEGSRFRDDLRVKGLYRPLTATQKAVRLVVGYVHLMTAIAWFGTILYVHILLKPAYASKGLPRGELSLGWISIVLILVTGILLTIARVPSWKVFYTTRFGILLSIKIFLFLVMLGSAVIVTTYIGPRLRGRRKVQVCDIAGDCTSEELASFDGREGRPARVAYKGLIYDVSGSRLWKDGSHLKRHAAGSDLTEMLKAAPHGEDKILAMPVVGKLMPAGTKKSRPFHERLFYFFAYMNLALTFLIVFIIALWRWW